MKANRNARFRRDDRAVSEIVGSVLLVSITVIMAAALGLTVFALTTPVDPVHANLSISLRPGANGWQTGDESIVIQHLGGEGLTAGQTTVRYTLAGTRTDVTDSALGSAFADGKFTIGETWSRTLTVPAGASVDVDVIVTTPGTATQVLATLQSDTTCTTDISPPFAIFTQLPTTLNSVTTGAIQVTATVDDLCSGVDTSVDPVFEFQVGSGAVQTATYVESPPNVFVMTIPDQSWSTHAGENLVYWLNPLADNEGNSGQSTHTDLIDDMSQDYPVTDFDDPLTIGLFTNFDNAKTGPDSVFAAYTEGDEATSNSKTIPAAEPTTGCSATDWSGRTDVDTDADFGASMTATAKNKSCVVPFADPTDGQGRITAVVVRAILASGGATESFQLTPCVAATCESATALSFPFANPVSVPMTTTGLTWSDINDISVNVETKKSGGGSGSWSVDYVYLEITSFDQDGELTLTIAGIPSGTNTLKILYEVEPATDTFALQVYDGSSFVTRAGMVLDDTTFTEKSTPLAVGEVIGGAARIRFIDLSGGNDESPGVLRLDYVRVQNS